MTPAYIGPGAGFAFFGSFLTLVLAVLAGLASLLIARTRFPWVDREVLIALHLTMLRDGMLARVAG